MILSTHPLLPHDIDHEEATFLGEVRGEGLEEPVLFVTDEMVYGKAREDHLEGRALRLGVLHQISTHPCHSIQSFHELRRLRKGGLGQIDS